MSTITRPPRRATTPPPSPRAPEVILGEQRIVIRNVSWDLYDRLSDAIDEHQHVYLAYDGKDLEIMTKGRVHEVYREFFGRLVNALTFELRIRCRGVGETTWKRPEIARGLESDLGYYFTAKKLAADAKARARKSNKVADYPNPDLAIEIDISPPEIDRPGIYAAMKVGELWRFDGERVVIERLGREGRYRRVAASRLLKIRASELMHWLCEEENRNETQWAKRLAAWLIARPERNRRTTVGTGSSIVLEISPTRRDRLSAALQTSPPAPSHRAPRPRPPPQTPPQTSPPAPRSSNSDSPPNSRGSRSHHTRKAPGAQTPRAARRSPPSPAT